jgi:alpha-beta hydrolase superfamily lysophospholipase
MREFRNSSGPLLKVPTLLLQALIDDFVVPEAEAVVCRKSPLCILAPLPGVRHNLLHDVDSIRNSAIARIKEYLPK